MFLNQLLTAEFSLSKTVVVLLFIAALASFDLFLRLRHRPTHLIFACIFGTIVSLGLIQVGQLFLHSEWKDNPHAMALAILLFVLGWRSLFGPWEARTKAAVLGTFLFWISLHSFAAYAPDERSIRFIAAGTALVPAAIWCFLFLKYHSERASSVLLMFFAGMLSTFPILLYDAFVRRGVTFQFFLFTITPENFSRNSQAFVSGHIVSSGGLKTALFTSLISFVIVGLIEEVSKYWVLTRSGRRLFTSIDDVMQLSIIVAIGFAFAENVINPMYFPNFVREYLITPDTPDFFGFFSNVLGRSVLTSMVHIVSTGVFGYFLGQAFFAEPLMAEEGGRRHPLSWILQGIFRLDAAKVYRGQMLLTGITCAIALHGIFNFLVTLPDLLPGNPATIGEALNMAEGSYLHLVPLLLLPSLFYVVGGFWLLSFLFLRKRNMQERGHIVISEQIVPLVRGAAAQ